MNNNNASNQKKWDILFAVQGTLWSFIWLNFFFFGMTSLYLFYQINANYRINKANGFKGLPAHFFPNEVVFVKEGSYSEETRSVSCDDSYSPILLKKWPGTETGVYAETYTYPKSCKIYCSYSPVFDYVKSDCYKSTDGDCCDYRISTMLYDQCKTKYIERNSNCECPLGVEKFNGSLEDEKRPHHMIDPILEREIPLLSINNLPLCQKIITTEVKLYVDKEENCYNGVFCNYACLYNTTSCPDYSIINKEFSASTQLIYSIETMINLYPLTTLESFNKNSTSDMIENESKNVLSKIDTKTNHGNVLYYSKHDNYLIQKGLKSELYPKQLIEDIQKIDTNFANDNDKYYTKLSSDFIVTFGRTHFEIKNIDVCRNMKININDQKNLNIQQAMNYNYALLNNAVEKSSFSSAWPYFDILFYALKLFFLVYTFLLRKKINRLNDHLLFFRFVLFSMIICLAYSAIKFYLNYLNNDTFDIVTSLKDISNSDCFINSSFQKFINDLTDGVVYYNRNSIIVSNEIFIMNFVYYVLSVYLLVPLFSFRKLFLFKEE